MRAPRVAAASLVFAAACTQLAGALPAIHDDAPARIVKPMLTLTATGPRQGEARRRLRRTSSKEVENPDQQQYRPDGQWDLCHYHYTASEDKYELLDRISEPAYEAHLHLHKVDVPLELFQTWTFVVTPRCRRVDRNCDVVGEVCTGRGHCQPQYASGSCSCDRGWGGHLCENDVMAPVFQRCPKDMHITGPGPKTKVTWQTPVATDNSDTPPTVEQKNGPANGADFSEGRTTVVYSATDDSGNQELCHFNVYVTHDNPLALNCLSDIRLSTDAGKATAKVVYATPTVSGGVGAVSILQEAPVRPRSGDHFPIGETEVVFTATDGKNQVAKCNFSVVVVDEEAPSISCPLDIVTENDEGVATAEVVWQPARATDNSGAVADLFLESLMADPRGDTDGVFPLGVHKMLYIALDAARNSAECAFTITVRDKDEPEVFCPDVDIVYDTDPASPSIPRPASLTDGVRATDDTGVVDLVCTTPKNPPMWSAGTYPVTCVATDGSDNQARCTYGIVVMVVDSDPPTVLCPPSLTVNADPSASTGRLDWGELAATDNVGVVGPVVCDPNPGHFPLGLTDVTCTAKDAAGNAGTCAFTVKVDDVSPPSMECPPTAALAAKNADGLLYSWSVAAKDESAGPVAVVCRLGDSGPDLTPDQFSRQLAVDEATRFQCRATDVSGNRAECEFTVTIKDQSPPVFPNCTSDLMFPPLPVLGWEARDGVTFARVCIQAPAAVDNVDGTSLEKTLELPTGASIIVVTTPFTTTTTSTTTTTTTTDADESGDLDESGDEEKRLGEGGAEAAVCDHVLVEFGLGSAGITFKAADQAGNVGSCRSNVEIRDATAPTFVQCPANIVVATDVGEAFSSSASWPTPLASDDTGIAPLVTRTSGPEARSRLGIGSHTVVYTAVDVGGNRATCSFDIVVTDGQAPTVRASGASPADNPDLVILDGVVYAFPAQLTPRVAITLPRPTVSDNLPSGWSINATRGDGLSLRDGYPEGSTTVTFTATDATGNSGSDTLTVTVVSVCSPEQLGGAIAWYSADTISPGDLVGNGSTLSRWQDVSGNANHLLRVAGGQDYQQPPDFVRDPISGRPAVRFTGSQYLEVEREIALEGTLAAVFDQSGPAVGGRSMELLGQVQPGTGITTILRLDPSTPDEGGPALNQDKPPYQLLPEDIRVNGAATNLFSPLSQRKVVTGKLATGAFRNRLSLGLGSTQTPRKHWHGNVHEVVFLRQCASDAVIQRVEGYLAWKWGTAASLPADHAYASKPPTCKAVAPTVDFFLEARIRQNALAWYSAADYTQDPDTKSWYWPDRSANEATLRPSTEFATLPPPTLLPFGQGGQPEVFFDNSLLTADKKVDLTPTAEHDVLFAAVVSSCAFDSAKGLVGHLEDGEKVNSVLRLEDAGKATPVLNKIKRASQTRNSVLKGEDLDVLPGGGNTFAKDDSFKIVIGTLSRHGRSTFGEHFLSLGASRRADLPPPLRDSRMWHGSVSEVVFMKSPVEARRRRDLETDLRILTLYLGAKYGVSTVNSRGSTGDGAGDGANSGSISNATFGAVVGILLVVLVVIVVVVVLARRRRKGKEVDGSFPSTGAFAQNPMLRVGQDTDVCFEERVVDAGDERLCVEPLDYSVPNNGPADLTILPSGHGSGPAEYEEPAFIGEGPAYANPITSIGAFVEDVERCEDVPGRRCSGADYREPRPATDSEAAVVYEIPAKDRPSEALHQPCGEPLVGTASLYAVNHACLYERTETPSSSNDAASVGHTSM